MFRNLMAEMARADINNKEMAEKIGIGETAYGRKLKGTNDWNVSEMIAIQKILNEELGTSYTLDYLFSPVA